MTSCRRPCYFCLETVGWSLSTAGGQATERGTVKTASGPFNASPVSSVSCCCETFVWLPTETQQKVIMVEVIVGYDGGSLSVGR